MQTKYEYYYNNVPEKGLCRNNLIYTSLISNDKKTFCQWYYNDDGYHGGHNQVVDPRLMNEKFEREVRGLTLMKELGYGHLIPEFDVDIKERKVYLTIDGPDMWELAGCTGKDYSQVVPSWEDQMLEIMQAHKDIGMYKYSLHPSSYFIVDGQLKSMNYFFTYTDNDNNISVNDVLSHISEDRRANLLPKLEAAGMKVDEPQTFTNLQLLAFDSFKNNFNNDIMEKAKEIYV
jgi:hypothetical protein|tara:strand:+ start:1157 stop:1852 length:696 start_codon:yes stop_codon:yes gene_type:complete